MCVLNWETTVLKFSELNVSHMIPCGRWVSRQVLFTTRNVEHFSEEWRQLDATPAVTVPVELHLMAASQRPQLGHFLQHGVD